MDQALWAETLEKWHDFFLMSGTAAVTLAGLVFVAISIHVDTLVQAKREHLLDLARMTLLSFTMILVLSLTMLMPYMSVRMVGVQMVILGRVLLSARWSLRRGRDDSFVSLGATHRHPTRSAA